MIHLRAIIAKWYADWSLFFMINDDLSPIYVFILSVTLGLNRRLQTKSTKIVMVPQKRYLFRHKGKTTRAN